MYSMSDNHRMYFWLQLCQDVCSWRLLQGVSGDGDGIGGLSRYLRCMQCHRMRRGEVQGQHVHGMCECHCRILSVLAARREPRHVREGAKLRGVCVRQHR